MEMALQQKETAIEEKKVADAKIQELQRLLESTLADKQIVDDALQETEVKIKNMEASLEVANARAKPDVLFTREMGRLSETERR